MMRKMKKQFPFILILLSLPACTPYYTAPFSAPPVLEKAGDIDVGLNTAKSSGSFEYGFKGSILPHKNIYAQFNWQKGSFGGSGYGFTEGRRSMAYQYNEISAGYMKDFGMIRASAGAYYGFGSHRIVYNNWDAPSGFRESAFQFSRMQQIGVQTSVYLELDDDFLVAGSLRYQQFLIENIQKSGDFHNMKTFNDPQKANIFTPCFSIFYRHDFFNLGFHSGYTYSVNKDMPDIKPSYASMTFAFNLNYRDILKK
jgi:hypothetical protein